DSSKSSVHRCFQTSCLANPLPLDLLPTIPVYRNLFATKKPYTSTKLQIILITL
ncbi:unnamed protein product, partial [Musa hybrid cultivar]